MALYEITYIARQEITEADVTAITKTFTDIISGNKGKVLKTEYWGIRDLSLIHI